LEFLGAFKNLARGTKDPRSGRSFNFPKKDGTSPAINCGNKNIKIEIFILDIYIIIHIYIYISIVHSSVYINYHDS